MRLKTVILLACLCVLTSCSEVAYAQLGPAIGNITTSGATCSATSPSANCVTLKLDGSTGAATILITGTFVGTGQFEVSNDGLSTWTNINCTPPNSTTAASSATAAGSWQCNVAGWEHIRVRASAFVSGTMSVVINGAHASAKSGGGAVYASGLGTNNVIPKGNGAGQLSDSPLLAPDANTVRQANTTTAQVLEIYGTTDSNATPVNYEKVMIGYNALSVQSTYQFVTTKGGTGTNRGVDWFLGTGNFSIGTTTPSRTFVLSSSTGLLSTYGGLTVVGQGVSAIRAASRSTAQSAAVASVATYTPNADASFLVSANVLVTTATTHSFTVTCAYTDEGNTARTLTLPFVLVAGSAITNTIANAAGAVPYQGIPVQIRAKASTSITIATTGTFTTVTYNVEGTIQQVN